MAGLISLIILIITGGFIIIYTKLPAIKQKKKFYSQPFSEEWKNILESKVIFYRNLSQQDKEKFCGRIKAFLSEVRITGVEVEVTDSLRLLVASSAIIPVFSFEQWSYINLNEILVYNGLVETY